MEDNTMPGGYLVGNSHSDGGIKIKTPEGQIEAEGGEVIINKRVLAKDEKFVCEGTPKEITSKINEMEGGVSWSETGSCKLVRKAEDGTEIEEEGNISDDGFGLLYTKNNKKFIVTADTKDQIELVDMAIKDYKDGLIDKENLENTLQSYMNDEEEFTGHIVYNNGKPFVYNDFYRGYIELYDEMPIDATSSEIEFALGGGIDKAALGYDFGEKESSEMDLLPKELVKQKINELENQFQAIRLEFRNNSLTQEEYFSEKQDLINKYNDYIDAAKRQDIAINQSLFLGIIKKKEKEQAARGTILRSSNPEKRPSPSVSATIYPEGYEMEGNDGNTWVISIDSRGVHRWKRLKAEDGFELEGGEQHSIEQPKERIATSETELFTFNDSDTKGVESYYRFKEDIDRADDIYFDFTYDFYKGGKYFCSAQVIINDFEVDVEDFHVDKWDYARESHYTEAEGYSTTYSPTGFYVEETVDADGKYLELSDNDMKNLKAEIGAIFKEKIMYYSTETLAGFQLKYGELIDILKKHNIEKAADGMKNCGCGCGVAEDGKDLSSCGCSHSKYKDGGYVLKGVEVEDIAWLMKIAEEDDAALEFNDNETIVYFDMNELSEINRKKAKSIFTKKMKDGGGVDWEKRDNLEKFLSYTNDDIYWKWVNNELTDSEAIAMIEEIDGVKFTPNKEYNNGGGVAARGKVIVTKIEDIPNLQQELKAGRVTYRGLGLGKLYDDFHEIANESGTRIKVEGKEYYITDTDFRKLNWDEKNKKWKNLIRFSAPPRREDGGGVEKAEKGKELWFTPSGKLSAEKEGTARKMIEMRLAQMFGATSMSLVGEDEKHFIYELDGNSRKIEMVTAKLQEDKGLDVETYGRKKRVHIPKTAILQSSAYVRFPLLTPFKDGGKLEMLNDVPKGYLYLSNITNTSRKPNGRLTDVYKTNLSHLPANQIEQVNLYLESLNIDYTMKDYVPNYNPNFNEEDIPSTENYVIGLQVSPEKVIYFFVDTQGYDYPRYVTELINYNPEYYDNGGKITNSELETINGYERKSKEDYDNNLKIAKGDDEMISMYRRDFSDHVFVSTLMRDGKWEMALETWRDMDTAARENISNDAYELLMGKNNLPTYRDGGGVGEFWVQVDFENTHWHSIKMFGILSEAIHFSSKLERLLGQPISKIPVILNQFDLNLQTDFIQDNLTLRKVRIVDSDDNDIAETDTIFKDANRFLICKPKWDKLIEDVLKESDTKNVNDWLPAKKSTDCKSADSSSSPYSARYMYSPSLDKLRYQNEGEWYGYGSVSDTFSNGGGVESSKDKVWQIKKGNKYYSIGLQDGQIKWNESPDLGYSYDYESAEKLSNYLREEHSEIEIVKYDKDWWKKEDGGDIEYAGGGRVPIVTQKTIKEHIDKLRFYTNLLKEYKEQLKSTNLSEYEIEQLEYKDIPKAQEGIDYYNSMLSFLLKQYFFQKGNYYTINKKDFDFLKEQGFEDGGSIKYEDGGGMGMENEYAKGGEIVKYYSSEDEHRLSRPSSDIEKELLEKVNYHDYLKPLFIGNFGWKTPQGKLADGYLFELDEYDMGLIGTLKPNEKVFRYINRMTAISGSKPLIKINLEKGLLYFLTQNEDYNNDDIVFETRGVKASWISLMDKKAADGKTIEGADYLTNAMLSILDLHAYVSANDNKIRIFGSEYTYMSHSKYNLRVTGGKGAVYNIIPYFPTSTVEKLQQAHFYTLVRQGRSYNFAITKQNEVIDLAEDGIQILTIS